MNRPRHLLDPIIVRKVSASAISHSLVRRGCTDDPAPRSAVGRESRHDPLKSRHSGRWCAGFQTETLPSLAAAPQRPLGRRPSLIPKFPAPGILSQNTAKSRPVGWANRGSEPYSCPMGPGIGFGSRATTISTGTTEHVATDHHTLARPGDCHGRLQHLSSCQKGPSFPKGREIGRLRPAGRNTKGP